jgi:hypothetical protein
MEAVANKSPPPATTAPVVEVPPTVKELFAEGKQAYLTDLQEFDVQAGACPIGKNGNLGNGSRISILGKEKSKSIGMHPSNPPMVAKASFRLEKQRGVLRGGAALNDTAEQPWGAALFAIHGDGKLLWKSPPVKERGKVEEFELEIGGVEILELSVAADPLSHYVHAVWVEPRLMKK